MHSAAVILASLLGQAQAHTFVWGVFVNGVDQGLFQGIRTPPYNNGPGAGGYSNSPVKNVTSIDIRCNVLGEVQNAYTIKVAPGDNLTLDWHHNYRNDTDDVIDRSHKGPVLAYLSPDPPADNSFVKIFEEGKFKSNPFPQPGLWATSDDLALNHGHQNVRIPADLKAGNYLLRAEMIGLHEADVSWLANPNRGAQFYPNCIQLEVTGDGQTELPEGVSFPGAYAFSDPGVVHNVYCSTETTSQKVPCTSTYIIPGPTVWSGAWPTTTSLPVGPMSGGSTATPWSTWIVKSVVTSASYTNAKSVTVMGTSTYADGWSATYQTPAPTVTARW